MAYGVKYRLDFEDELGNGKRLDILKDDYTGEVLPLIGGAEPVTIKWDGDDDFYSPIIGSTCSINLYETDEVTYDDFFNEPEREYKVEVYTAQAIRDEFKNNVELDGGIVEGADCISGSYYDTGTLLQSRVVNDGGIMEAVDCVSAVLTEKQDNYTLFWTGWLLSDQFKQVMAPNPQPVQLTAIDGLGDLDNVFVDNTFYSISSNDLAFYLSSILCKSLEKTGLEIDVILNNDIEIVDFFGNTSNLYTNVFTGNEEIFLSDDYEFFNVKEFLENILKNINARVFQANGKYVVLNNSTYSEQVIIDYVKDYKEENDALPSGIGNLRHAYLKGDIESLKFERFSSAGTSQGDFYHEGLRTVRTDLQPLEQNLTREAERGFKAIRLEAPISKTNLSYQDDASFEFQNTTHWSISNGAFRTDDIAKSGNRSFRTTATNYGATPTSLALTGNYSGRRGVASKLQLSYYYDTNNTTQSTTLYNKFWCQIYFVGGSVFYYDTANKNWTTTVKYFFFEDDKSAADKWRSQSLEIAELPAAAGQTQTVYLAIFGPSNYLLNYQAVYIDDTIINRDEERGGTSQILLTQDDTTNVIVNDVKIERYLTGLVLGYTDLHDPINILNVKFPMTATQTQQLNDFRTIVTRYEGTLYNNESAPVTPMDKIRINFTNFSEADSLILDGLEYSVKSNRYNIIAHKPNQDNPVDATETTKTKTFKFN